jgi:hypothetical protein
MHMELCNLEQTWLRVFRYGRLVLDGLQVALERDGFEGVAVAGVMKALSRIAEERFDFSYRSAHTAFGDGFAVVSAMCHS